MNAKFSVSISATSIDELRAKIQILAEQYAPQATATTSAAIAAPIDVKPTKKTRQRAKDRVIETADVEEKSEHDIANIKGAPSITEELLSEAATECIEAIGLPKTRAIVKAYGADKIGQVKEKDYSALYGKLTDAITAKKPTASNNGADTSIF